jgi:hypothetical protein
MDEVRSTEDSTSTNTAYRRACLRLYTHVAIPMPISNKRVPY